MLLRVVECNVYFRLAFTVWLCYTRKGQPFYDHKLFITTILCITIQGFPRHTSGSNKPLEAEIPQSTIKCWTLPEHGCWKPQNHNKRQMIKNYTKKWSKIDFQINILVTSASSYPYNTIRKRNITRSLLAPLVLFYYLNLVCKSYKSMQNLHLQQT